jgi:NAD(P)-dependent dehydrogenase (short-subunit alcohol dehydrogenase family)
VDEVNGKKLEAEVAATTAAGEKPRAIFTKVDVVSYESNLALFELALKTYGKVDFAVPLAGIVEKGDWFDPNLDVQSVREASQHLIHKPSVLTIDYKAPTIAVLDVNLKGTMYFSRIAVPYLKHGAKTGDNKALILISSVAGFKECPVLFIYQSTKHGVLGLMRALRSHLPVASPIPVRVNAVCPWMTFTNMTSMIEQQWRDSGLPFNTADDVARIVVQIAVEEGMNGKGVYVEGGRGWDVERGLERTEGEWLGKEPSRTLNEGQLLLSKADRREIMVTD